MIGAIVCATCERAARGMLHLPDGELTGPKFEIGTTNLKDKTSNLQNRLSCDFVGTFDAAGNSAAC